MKKGFKWLFAIYMCIFAISLWGNDTVEAASLPTKLADLGESFTGRITFTKAGRNLSIYGGSNVITYTASDSTAQQWKFVKQSDGSYEITNVKYKKCLEVAGGSGKSSANVQIGTDDNSKGQRWFLYSVNGAYAFRPATATNCVMHVKGGSVENSANVLLSSYYAGSAQLFVITIVSTSTDSNTSTNTDTVNKNTTTTKKEYYNDYSTVASIYDRGSVGSMQGMAVGKTYAYTAKISTDNGKAFITKTNVNTGKSKVLTDSSTGSIYMSYLGHANDMCVTTINGKSHLYIATMKTGSYSIVKLRVDGSKIKKVGNYTVKYNGTVMSPSAVTILSKTSSKVNFLFKKGNTIYKGSVGLNKNSGTINITKAFKINTKKATINGVATDISHYTHQGFSYYKNKIYVPLADVTKRTNRSIVLVYDITNASGTIKADKNLSFRIISSTYSALFEIEACGICSSNGKLYFNTNRRKSSYATNYDGIHVFKGYSAK